MITTITLIILTIILLIISFVKSRKKTKESVFAARNMFLGVFKEVLGILLLLGILLAFIPEKTISSFLGSGNVILSTIYGAIIGTITIIPGVIAFPLAKELKEKGAVLTALAAFITTLTMVGLATLPIEIKYFGKKFSFYRNLLSFLFAIMIALLVGGLV